MNRSFQRRFSKSARPLIEALEPRHLLSMMPMLTAGILLIAPPTAVTTSSMVLSGKNIHAEAGQAFRAVIGTINHLYPLPTIYTLAGRVNWGDGSATSAATFVPQADGSIAVLGSHTYAAAGSDKIVVTVAAVPPLGTLMPVRLIGIIHSTADVIEPDGGTTLNATAGVDFTANVGTFRSPLSSLTMTAVIDWGDGTQSVGKILALPTAGPVAGGAFAVVGDHTYATTDSFLVHITVYSSYPSPIVSPTGATPPVILVAQIDTVIDVLPVLPTATG